MIGRDQIPRHVASAAFAQGILIGCLVAIPVFPSCIIRLTEFPVSGGVIEPPLEAAELLVFANVQEKFRNVHPIRREPLLEIVDLFVPLRSNVLGNQIVNADNHHIFLVGAVEDHNLAALGGLLFDPPKKVMRQFLR